MADPKDQIDDEDNIFDEGEFEDDGTADIIRKAFAEAGEDDPDDGGFDQPLDAKTDEEPDVVSPETGRDLLDDAEMAKAKGKTPGEDKKTPTQKPDEKNGDIDAEGEKDDASRADDKAEGGDDDEKGGKDDDASDLGKAGVDTLLDGLPDDRKVEVTRRLRDADQAMAPFKNAYIQGQMKEWGANPTQVASRLVELASFAREKPDEYIAWVATQSATPEKMGELLTRAGKLLGYKVVRESDGDEDDMFDDPAVKALREENARLKAQVAGDAPNFGPDTPERQQTRTASETLHRFTTETDESGNLKRPLFNQVKGRIVELAQQQMRETQRPGTEDDLQRFYDTAVSEIRNAFGVTDNPPPPSADSAAQGGQAMAKQMKDKAAAAEKARRASKSVDGTGQGASRRPALSDDAPLEDVIRHFSALE